MTQIYFWPTKIQCTKPPAFSQFIWSKHLCTTGTWQHVLSWVFSRKCCIGGQEGIVLGSNITIASRTICHRNPDFARFIDDTLNARHKQMTGQEPRPRGKRCQRQKTCALWGAYDVPPNQNNMVITNENLYSMQQLRLRLGLTKLRRKMPVTHWHINHQWLQK